MKFNVKRTRPKSAVNVVISLRVKCKYNNEILRLGKKYKLSKTDIINQMIEYCLNNLSEEDK